MTNDQCCMKPKHVNTQDQQPRRHETQQVNEESDTTRSRQVRGHGRDTTSRRGPIDMAQNTLLDVFWAIGMFFFCCSHITTY
jgi:hypothetical protein